MHMMRSDSQIFKKFGEIYFSTIFNNKIKAWHLHKEATLNYACVFGSVKLTLFDDRKNSETKGVYQELFLSLDNYSLITIPPNIWNGFKGLNKDYSIRLLSIHSTNHGLLLIYLKQLAKIYFLIFSMT